MNELPVEVLEEDSSTETTRKLASIQVIESLKPIEGADKIEVATLVDLGWDIVVQKDLHKVGDKVVYFEIDSILPDEPVFVSMINYGFRIKTIKLRGQVSQGLIYPLQDLASKLIGRTKYQSGEDVTELIGVTKYIPKFSNAGNHSLNMTGSRGTFPGFLRKTDETRVQSIKSLLHKYEGTKFYAAEKLDGSSITCYVKEGKVGVTSRNCDFPDYVEGNSFWEAVKKEGLDVKVKEISNTFGIDVAVQGELIGPGKNGNRLGLNDTSIYIFNIYNISNKCFFSFDDFKNLCSSNKIKHVPIIHEGLTLGTDPQEYVNMADMNSKLASSKRAEGLVFRPHEEIVDEKFGRVSFKAISNSYLLKHGL